MRDFLNTFIFTIVLFHSSRSENFDGIITGGCAGKDCSNSGEDCNSTKEKYPACLSNEILTSKSNTEIKAVTDVVVEETREEMMQNDEQMNHVEVEEDSNDIADGEDEDDEDEEDDDEDDDDVADNEDDNEEEEDDDDTQDETPNPDISDPCLDVDLECPYWAEMGECEVNPGYMLRDCQKSCFVCLNLEEIFETDGNGDECDDHVGECWDKAFEGECAIDDEVKEDCAMSCGTCIPRFDLGYPQYYGDHEGDNETLVLQSIGKSHRYLINEVMHDPHYARVKNLCTNKHNLCNAWAVNGECETDSEFMLFECPLACQRCDHLDIEIRCPIDEEQLLDINAWAPGDMNKMFERISNKEDEEYTKYNPKVLSHPSKPINECSMWVVTLDTFLSPEEADRIVELAAIEGYERSETVNEQEREIDGEFASAISKDRTSMNAWCDEICGKDPMMIEIIDRIQNVTGIPKENQENFQLLKYEGGEFYKAHTDYIPFRFDGPRILTFFLYLNEVEEGGGTSFPHLEDLTVIPKKGKALLFPSVLNDDPMAEEECSEHEAMPVLKGTKHAANVWIHMRDRDATDGCE